MRSRYSQVDGVVSGAPLFDAPALLVRLQYIMLPRPQAKHGEGDRVRRHRGSLSKTSSYLVLPKIAER
jgi:hypothetical protein